MQVEDFFRVCVSKLRDRHLETYDRRLPTHTFSPAFEKNMRDLIAQKRRSAIRVQTGRVWRQAACFALATLVGLGACFVGVGAWSSRFLRMVEQKYPDHTSIEFARTGQGAAQTSDAQYTLTAVPDGFRRVQHTNSPDGFLNLVVYENDNEKIISFDQTFAENISMNLNTEGANLETLEFRGHPARFLENDGWCMLLWYDDKYVYSVDTFLSREETMKLAENVTIKSMPYPTLQKIPIESLPENYTPELALENGDVVFQEAGIQNLEKLEQFVADSEQGKNGAVRLVRFAPDGSALIYDLQMEAGHIYYTADEHRWPDSEHPWEDGQEYDSISILTNGDAHVLLLYSRRFDAPKEIFRY